MKAKTKLIISLAVTGIMLISVPASIASMAFALPSVYSSTFYGAMKGKLDLLKEKKEGTRVIFIGGSSVPFSLDCSLIKQELPSLEPIDFGLYASLGTTMMLDLAKQDIRKGDIVIITPEQSEQTLSLYFNADEAWKALDCDTSYFHRLASGKKAALLSAMPRYVADKIKYSKDRLDPTGIYKASSFNEYGDVSASRPYNIMPDGIDANQRISFAKESISKDFVSYLNDFHKDVWGKGAKVYYRFAPANEEAVENKDEVDAFYEHLASSLRFDIMGDPHRSIMEKQWFYDTNYHLNSSGAIKFTKAVIQDLKLLLSDTSKTNIEDPELPPLSPVDYVHGDDSDLPCFEFGDSKETYFIESLSELGKTKERIVIPTYYQEKPIVEFRQSVFQNAKKLKEVVIQGNIRSILDDSFANSSLERIVIQSTDPASISIGKGLLNDCAADICVPKDSLNDYIVHYQWAPYASRLKASS